MEGGVSAFNVLLVFVMKALQHKEEQSYYISLPKVV